MIKRIKVLYVCPFAHYEGHFPWASIYETRALKQAGIDVELLTFCGVRDKTEVEVPQATARQYMRLRLGCFLILLL